MPHHRSLYSRRHFLSGDHLYRSSRTPRTGKLSTTFAGSDIAPGAGTVPDPETARIAILSGAEYIVSPSFREETVRMCNRYRILSIPGVSSARDIEQAMTAGADMLKLFPGNVYGPQFVKDMLGPFPRAEFMVTGKCSYDNIGGMDPSRHHSSWCGRCDCSPRHRNATAFVTA